MSSCEQQHDFDAGPTREASHAASSREKGRELDAAVALLRLTLMKEDLSAGKILSVEKWGSSQSATLAWPTTS